MCIHIITLLLSIVLLRDYLGDEARPKWVELTGTRFVDPKVLDKCGLTKPWHRYLNSIVSLEDVKDDEIVWTKKVSKKRGPKLKIQS
jgi:hypothetical protein